MKTVKRKAMRALYRFACFMDGYIGKELVHAAVIALVVIPGCYIFLFAGVALSA